MVEGGAGWGGPFGAGERYEGISLVGRDVEGFGEKEGQLAGRAALTGLDFEEGNGGAAEVAGKLVGADALVFAALFEPAAEGDFV
jgi:hypothetical protein